MPQQARFLAIKRSIDRGSDLLVQVLMRSDPFLTDGLLSEIETTTIVDHWKRTRLPEEFVRLQRLEADAEILSRASKILTRWQLSCANQAIVAPGVLPAPYTPVRGAPGPQPKNHAAVMSLAERGYATQAAVDAARR